MTAKSPEDAIPTRRIPLALWLALPILVANLAISIIAFASTATIPLDVLLAGGSETLIALALFLGLSDLLLASLFVVALLRFRLRRPLIRSLRAGPSPDRRLPAGPYLPQPL